MINTSTIYLQVSKVPFDLNTLLPFQIESCVTDDPSNTRMYPFKRTTANITFFTPKIRENLVAVT